MRILRVISRAGRPCYFLKLHHYPGYKILVASLCLSYYGRLAFAFDETFGERLTRHARSDSAWTCFVVIRSATWGRGSGTPGSATYKHAHNDHHHPTRRANRSAKTAPGKTL